MGNICEPYCACNCNCENQKILKDCQEGCGNCLQCEDCHQCTECDPRMMNPCLIRETSNKELMIVLKEFDFKGEAEDKWYGDVQILEHKIQKEIVVLKIVESSSETEAEQVQQQFIRRIKLNHEHIVRLRYIVHKAVDAFCSVIYKSYLFFDYLLTDLATDLKNRNKKGLYFSEDEIWNMAYCLINGMKYLYSVNITHGCVRSKNVYITQYGSFKVADPGLFNYEVNYDIVFNNQDNNHKGIILSPAQVHGLERHIETPIHDQQKSDVFCIGMVILEAASLLSADSCFDYYHAWVLEDKIQDRLNEIKSKYHDSLYYMLKEMLTINEIQRPNFQTLFEKNQRNPKFKTILNHNYQAQAQFQIQNPDQSDTASVLNQSYMTHKPAPQVLNSVKPNNLNLVASKPFDNFSIIDGIGAADDAPNFGISQHQNANQGIDILGLGGNSNFNLNSNNNLLGQFSMPPPMMGLGFSSAGVGNYLSGTSGLDFTSSMAGTKLGREKISENYKNGSRYEGEVRNGVRDGKGKYYYNNGGYYEGSWKDGKMNGQGTLYFPDGSTAYDGSWRDDQFHGYGTLYNNSVQPHQGPFDYKNFNNLQEKWLKYEGDFKSDQKEGFGTLFVSNGERYVGGFKQDKIHGQGTFYTQSNQVIKGRWANNFMS
ncbi:protein kinase (macronuclear) [Tetrahymena thermophila SB210]|uniref:Protein kinase n=1 Tax=Tetrahymena thermophila (strain SB210) TaxID=312017 RepID=I7M8Q4_TETTS|nr:protein kinase [Tetrahymena thermophila SB210]EAR99464.1 protein kinase [Tetrahymena thermophila SB210]|eukprot:XP_001019709.1 protein kinase [Tetrahymena thermophila SB210]